MKNACKHFALCTLTLILCLALAACGSDDSGDSADYGNDSTVPSTIDGFVKESYDSYDYSAFEGYYLPDSGTDFDYLIIDTNGSRWRIGSNDDLAASGYLQYDADYDCIYAYNEHDGIAYQFSADGSSVNIYSLGSFTYEMSLDEFDAQAEDYNSSDSSVDLSYLAGIWYLDGDLDADSYIYIDSSGGLWSLYERAPGAETTEVDSGFISAPTDVDDVYYAVSTTYQDVTYYVHTVNYNGNEYLIEFAYSTDWQYNVSDWAMVLTKSYMVYLPDDYDGLVFAAMPQLDNYKDCARRMQLDSIAPEASIMDIDLVDPYNTLFFSICY